MPHQRTLDIGGPKLPLPDPEKGGASLNRARFGYKLTIDQANVDD